MKEGTLNEILQALCDPENQPHQWIGNNHALREAINTKLEKVRNEERERCQIVVCTFEKLDQFWKIVICAAINNPDWHLDSGRFLYEKLQEIRNMPDKEMVKDEEKS